MGQALYRKYRSKSLDELVGQEHITKTLKNALKSGKISHAYLLTGPRGVGKTSVARIMAFAVNGLPYDETGAHLDIIEIDAASNRRIDEIRDLRDKVHILPVSAKYKVYIIDEVHMLTREAFNALLKTLEEPPAHVIFILATTEAHKLPETIISRTQHFAFRPIDNAVVQHHLKSIAKAEKIAISDDALLLIAQHGSGSFRDSISLLDQARHVSDKIERADIEQLLGLAPSEAVHQLVDIIGDGTAQSLLTCLSDLQQSGYQAAQIAKQLAEQLRTKLLAGPSAEAITITELLGRLLDVAGSTQPDQLLEIILLQYILNHAGSDASWPTKAVKPASSSTKAPANTAVSPDPPTDLEQSVRGSHGPEITSAGDFTIELWPTILSHLKKQYNTLYGILRMAEASLSGNTLQLTFQFAFHEKQIKQKKNRTIICEIIKAQTGSEITLECRVAAAKKDTKPTSTNSDSPAVLDTVSNIFGGGEVLES